MSLDLKHLQKVEAGQLNLTMVTLVRIASGLGVPVADLFTEEESTDPGKKTAKASDKEQPRRTKSFARIRAATGATKKPRGV